MSELSPNSGSAVPMGFPSEIRQSKAGPISGALATDFKSAPNAAHSSSCSGNVFPLEEFGGVGGTDRGLRSCNERIALPSAVLQSRASPDESNAPNVAPSRLNDNARIDATPRFRTCVVAPVIASQIRTVWSAPAEAMRFPSGLYAKEETDFERLRLETCASVCPFSAINSRAVATSQSLT